MDNIQDEILLYKTLRGNFRHYLEIKHPNLKAKSTIISDAFFPYRNDIGINFWEIFLNEINLDHCHILLEQFLKDIKKVKNPKSDSQSYFHSIKRLKSYIDSTYGSIRGYIETTTKKYNNSINPLYKTSVRSKKKYQNSESIIIPTPNKKELERYLSKWNTLENYIAQENALNKLFFDVYPRNHEIENVLIKVSSLNDFYSTNIFSPYTVSKHIVGLDIDSRLNSEDLSLVDDIAKVTMDNGSRINFYSFATKYCSHHKPFVYPIYDSYVDKVLRYFRDRDNFFTFQTKELKMYSSFLEILNRFQQFYDLSNFSMKDIDKYLWQVGKDKFPNSYSRK